MIQHRILAAAAALILGCSWSLPAPAATLTVSPIGMTVIAPGNSTSLTVRNGNPQQVTIQVRVFKWSTQGGKDDYQETRDVVVSPPIATVGPRGQLQVRVLRVSRAPVKAEENFRVVIDEVPDANRVRNVGVNVALRYTLPLFFLDPNAGQARVQWSVRTQGGKRVLVATNTGDRHLRIANLSIGKTVVRKGLAGYVLGHSTRTFDLPSRAPIQGAISADTAQGRLNATVNR